MRCGVDIVKRSGVDHHSLPWAIHTGTRESRGPTRRHVIGHFKAVYMWRVWINSLQSRVLLEVLELPGSPHSLSPVVGGHHYGE